MPMSQVALAWVADRPAVTSVILGARTVAQLDDNLGPPACTCPTKKPSCSPTRAPRSSPTTPTAPPASSSAHATFG